MAQVRAAMEAVKVDAGLGSRNSSTIDLGVFCLAGADLPSDDRAIARWLRRAQLVSEVVIRNDTFAVLRAGTERSWGVGVVCGYGTNCSAVSPDGRVTRFPAIGPVSGDWGGGIDLGGGALWHAIRDEDGRGTRTVLRGSIPPVFGLRRPRQVMEALYRGTLDEQRLADLTPMIFRAARDGDAIAADLVGRQADEIVAMATVAIRRLRMQRLDVDVVLGGGVFRNDWRPFFDRIRGGIQEVAPLARLVTLKAPPVVGAAMIGLDQLGAAAPTHTRLRAALTHARLKQHTASRKER
jgi:N-acetylglucosamine kinase-like BadF-type ATPase